MMEAIVIGVVVAAGVYAVMRMYKYKRERDGKGGDKGGSRFPTDPQ